LNWEGCKIKQGFPEPPRYGGEQMKNSDNNYLNLKYKNTKMMKKVTACFRQQFLMMGLFQDIGGTPRITPRS
jgi:hypothetical protein